jgi:transposase InsO family protein
VSHATHANAALTPRARLRLARLVVDHGWPPARAAERYDVSWRTAKKWADRYRAEGPAGKKLGKVPDGGGWRYVGRQQGLKNKAATVERTGVPRNKWRNPLIGTCYLHTVIDDHSRVAYLEARDDETKETATEVLKNAVAWFAERGVTVKRVLSDNGSCYKSHLWRDTCTDLGITPKKTRPYRPQTNGKIERFHRTLAEGWAFKKFYNSESARLAALPAWVHEYNHHRPHSAIGKAAPITRLDNLPGHHT